MDKLQCQAAFVIASGARLGVSMVGAFTVGHIIIGIFSNSSEITS